MKTDTNKRVRKVNPKKGYKYKKDQYGHTLCPICGLDFSDSRHMTRHIAVHKGKRMHR